MMRRLVLALAVAAGTWMAGAAYGQMGGGGGPGGFGGGGPGGFDPAMMQQMMDMRDQVMQNMQNAGVDPMQFFQDQMQNGNFDPQSMAQTLMDKGFMTQDQFNQMNNFMNQVQQQFQQGNMGAMMQNNALNNIKQQLNATDEEWTVLLPKIERVLTVMADVQQNASGAAGNRGGFGGFGGRGGAAGGGANVPVGAAGAPVATETPIAKAWRELQAAVQDDQTADEEVAAKLKAWRQLHEAARQDLEGAQKDLVQFVTLRQEAVLVRIGVL